MRVKLFSRAFLSKIGALVLLLSLFFVPLVVQSTSASFTSSATAKTTVKSYASWDPSNLSVVAGWEENVSTVTSGVNNKISISYTPQLILNWKEPEYISTNSSTYQIRIHTPTGIALHTSSQLGGSPGANASLDVSSDIAARRWNPEDTYSFWIKNLLISNSSYIEKDFKVTAFPSTASNYSVVIGTGITGSEGTKISITAPQGTTITDVSWPTQNRGTFFGKKETDTSTEKVWTLSALGPRCGVDYRNLTPMTYRFYDPSTNYTGPENTITVHNCGTSM